MLAAFAALVLAASPFSPFDVLPSGPLADTQCNLETVEAANEHQLHTLLAELSTAPFFRLINVNMDGKCQYWGGPEEEEHVCVSKAEDTAEPLCTLGTDNSASDPFGAAATGGGGSPFSSSMSPPREQSSVPTDPVDVTITPEEHAYVGTIAEDCNDETLPSFWLDMCSAIPTNASDYVNLQLNEESYTGYNGSHVWAAIYNENCLVRTGSDQNICLEERVLYRLLSGMHAATNTHVARFYHPPSKRKNRTDWEPDLAYFARQFDGHPERLKNLHFAFVVLLRAVRRASPFLSTYDYNLMPSAMAAAAAAERGSLKEVGGMMDATALVRRFLDTAILKSCSAVFEAFDEGLLFREEQVRLPRDCREIAAGLPSSSATSASDRPLGRPRLPRTLPRTAIPWGHPSAFPHRRAGGALPACKCSPRRPRLFPTGELVEPQEAIQGGLPQREPRHRLRLVPKVPTARQGDDARLWHRAQAAAAPSRALSHIGLARRGRRPLQHAP